MPPTTKEQAMITLAHELSDKNNNLISSIALSVITEYELKHFCKFHPQFVKHLPTINLTKYIHLYKNL